MKLIIFFIIYEHSKKSTVLKFNAIFTTQNIIIAIRQTHP